MAQLQSRNPVGPGLHANRRRCGQWPHQLSTDSFAQSQMSRRSWAPNAHERPLQGRPRGWRARPSNFNCLLGIGPCNFHPLALLSCVNSTERCLSLPIPTDPSALLHLWGQIYVWGSPLGSFGRAEVKLSVQTPGVPGATAPLICRPPACTDSPTPGLGFE